MTVQASAKTSGQFVVLWDRVPPTNRDRSARFTAAEIAHVAFAVADAENLLGVSVKRVANRLRVPSARLEQYLPSRDELHDLMLDVCLGEISLPDPDVGLGWRAELEQLAEATYRVARTHRWLVELIVGRPPSGPNGLRFIERALAALGSTGLDVRSSALCFNALLSFVCGSIRVEARPGTSPRTNGRANGDARYLTHAVSGEEYPRLTALFSEAGDLSSEESFTFGLSRLLDGIAAHIERDTSGGSRP